MVHSEAWQLAWFSLAAYTVYKAVSIVDRAVNEWTKPHDAVREIRDVLNAAVPYLVAVIQASQNRDDAATKDESSEPSESGASSGESEAEAVPEADKLD